MAVTGSVSGSGDVRIEGLSQTLRALAKAGADAADMKDLMQAIGNLVVEDASPPVDSGSLAGSMRASRTKNKAVIRAGGARVPYAPAIHWGWERRNIAAQPFLSEAVDNNRDAILAKLDDGIGDILHKNNLT